MCNQTQRRECRRTRRRAKVKELEVARVWTDEIKSDDREKGISVWYYENVRFYNDGHNL